MFPKIFLLYLVIGLKTQTSLNQENSFQDSFQSSVTKLKNELIALQDSDDNKEKTNSENNEGLVDETDSSQVETEKPSQVETEKPSQVETEKPDSNQKKPAVALNEEWKTVAQDDVLPAEASVKVHLGTGEKMAKIDENNFNPGKKYLVFDKTKPFTFEDLKKGLKSIKKSKKQEKKNENNRVDYRDEKLVLEELKQYNFNDIAVSQVLREFLDNYTKSDTPGKIAILNEVEFLVHQYAIAHEFVSLLGIDLLLKDIHCENESLQGMIVMTLGSAMQGNPLVQNAVFEKNIIPVFLKFLKSGNSKLQSRAMFALSALIRQHTNALTSFVSLGGLRKLSEVFKQSGTSEKIRKKIIILVSDLVQERQIAEENTRMFSSPFDADVIFRERMALEKEMKYYGFCVHIISLLTAKEQDVREIVIQALSRFKYTCKIEFLSAISQLKHLELLYKAKAYLELLNETIDGKANSKAQELHYNELYNSISNTISALGYHSRDEL